MPTTDDFWAKVEQFRAKVADFFAVLARLREAQPLVEASEDPELKAAYAEQLERGSYIESTIATIQGTIESARAKLQQAADVFDGHMGVAPVILLGAIGLITGGLAAIGAWLANSYDLMKRLEAEASRQDTYNRLRADGLTHAEAVGVIEAARQREPAGVLDKATTVIVLAILGGLVWWASGRSA